MFLYISLHSLRLLFLICMQQVSELILLHHNYFVSLKLLCRLSVLSRKEYISGSINCSSLLPQPNAACSLLAMEGTESTARERTTGKDGKQEADQRVLMQSKPLHRFVQKEPRSLGVTHQTVQGHK